MSGARSWWGSGLGLRVATLLFPPFGLVLLWRSPRRARSKILGTIGIVLFSLIYAGVIAGLLVRSDQLKVEWRGGYMPALTVQKTLPDYDAIEKHRAQQRAAGLNAIPSTEAVITNVSISWPGFRGSQRDGV